MTLLTLETMNHSKRDLRIFAKSMLLSEEKHLHAIGDFVLTQEDDFYCVINKLSLEIRTYLLSKDGHEKALDFLLDKHNESKQGQGSLF